MELLIGRIYFIAILDFFYDVEEEQVRKKVLRKVSEKVSRRVIKRVAIRCLRQGKSVKEIIEITGLTKEQVEKIKQKLN